MWLLGLAKDMKWMPQFCLDTNRERRQEFRDFLGFPNMLFGPHFWSSLGFQQRPFHRNPTQSGSTDVWRLHPRVSCKVAFNQAIDKYTIAFGSICTTIHKALKLIVDDCQYVVAVERGRTTWRHYKWLYGHVVGGLAHSVRLFAILTMCIDWVNIDGKSKSNMLDSFI